MGARGRVTFSFCLVPFAICLLSAGGCRNCDLVEAELRSRENDLREVRADLARTEWQNQALVSELSSIRHGTGAMISPELASQTYTLKQVTLGRGTGGLDEDNCPGDEALQVVLEPRDGDGHTIKAPGSVHVEALEISPEGLKTALSSWDLTADQVRHTWRSGLLSTGYFIVLPWKNWPSSEKLRIIAQFTLADGRLFEADKDVAIRLTPLTGRKTSPLHDPVKPTAPSEIGPTLPPPRKLEEPKQTSTSKGWWLPRAGGADTAWSEFFDSVAGRTANSAVSGVALARGELPAPSPPGSSSQAATTERSIQPAAVWRPKPSPPLADSVQLLRPALLKYLPGEEQ
jgi:hypothetical protein